MIKYLIAFISGAICGVVLMALMVAVRDEE